MGFEVQEEFLRLKGDRALKITSLLHNKWESVKDSLLIALSWESGKKRSVRFWRKEDSFSYDSVWITNVSRKFCFSV